MEQWLKASVNEAGVVEFGSRVLDERFDAQQTDEKGAELEAKKLSECGQFASVDVEAALDSDAEERVSEVVQIPDVERESVKDAQKDYVDAERATGEANTRYDHDEHRQQVE